MKLGKWLPAAESVVALMSVCCPLMSPSLLSPWCCWWWWCWWWEWWLGSPIGARFPGESACAGSQAPLWPFGRPSPMATTLACGLSMAGVWRWECEPRGVPRLSTGRTAACCCALMKRATPSRRRRDLWWTVVPRVCVCAPLNPRLWAPVSVTVTIQPQLPPLEGALSDPEYNVIWAGGPLSEGGRERRWSSLYQGWGVFGHASETKEARPWRDWPDRPGWDCEYLKENSRGETSFGLNRPAS